MRPGICIQLLSTLRNTCGPRQCTFKFSMVRPHSISREEPFLTAYLSLDVAHVLPVLFPFTTPGKYCYRAVALFCKHVTDVQLVPLSPMDPNFSTSPMSLTPQNEMLQVPPPRTHRSLSLRIQHAASTVKRRSSLWSRPSAQGTNEATAYSGSDSCPSGQVTPRTQGPSDTSVDVAGPRKGGGSEPHADDVPMAGEAWVYAGNWVRVLVTLTNIPFFFAYNAYFPRPNPPSTKT